jgi:hypothetical protein
MKVSRVAYWPAIRRRSECLAVDLIHPDRDAVLTLRFRA